MNALADSRRVRRTVGGLSVVAGLALSVAVLYFTYAGLLLALQRRR